MLRPIVYEAGLGWYCVCDCGNHRHVAGNQLRIGRTLSCGCMKSGKPNDTRPGRSRKKDEAYRRKAIAFPRHGTPCWVCRNKTGVRELVALCKVCSGAKRIA